MSEKYPYKDDVIDRFMELFDNEKLNSFNEFFKNQEKYCKEIADKYEFYKPIPKTTLYKYLKKRPNSDDYLGQKVGSKNFNRDAYTKKDKKEKEKKKDDQKNNQDLDQFKTDTDEKTGNEGGDDVELKDNIEGLDRIENDEKNSKQLTDEDTENKPASVEGKDENEGLSKKKVIMIGSLVIGLIVAGYFVYQSVTKGGQYVNAETENTEKGSEREKETGSDKRGSRKVSNGKFNTPADL